MDNFERQVRKYKRRDSRGAHRRGYRRASRTLAMSDRLKTRRELARMTGRVPRAHKIGLRWSKAVAHRIHPRWVETEIVYLRPGALKFSRRAA